MADQEKRNQFWENRSLFSDYFLSERLDQKKEWKEDISAPFRKILQIYSNKKDALPYYNEAQTEKEFIQPVLEEVLEFQYDVQHTEKHRGKINTPDYVCFSDAETLLKAQKNRGDSIYYANALAIAEAKYWMRSLDEKGVSEKDLLTNVNPSFQIVKYLTVTGLEWGILTNGSKWRLYSSKGRSRIDSYFEVDLKQILEEEDKEQFRYFYLFFRKNAFLPNAQTGTSFLESVVQGSIEYGSRLEKKLKDLIFEDIFLDLGRGFVEYRGEEAKIREETEESLQEVYKGTLRLLYRLLFLLHAESRGLLPLNNKSYRQYSLMHLKKEIADRIDQDITPSRRSFDIWNDIDSVFRIIDKGDSALNVPRYNGGLFRGDHPNNQFLAEHKISDYYLIYVLEKLTRETDPETGKKRFIDYKSLNVEQLGSIYEGLLEFHLRIANETLAVVKEKGREVYKPEKDVKTPVKVLQEGELYLENDKGERKTTGSYYTPHYIVEYIVENTLGPVFEERAAEFRKIMDHLVPNYESFNKLDHKIKDGDKSTRLHNKRKGLKLDIEILEKRAIESLLSIKICDPAMGSGHFLKEATDKLAEKIIVLVGEYQENPISRMLEEVRIQILESLDKQNISIDAEEHLRDTNLIKRMVMKRSIYGVDLNPMAVELAKLSLWLDSFTVGAPLSFLDHHLRTGNSLIGTTVNEVKFTLEIDEDSQIDIFGGPFAGLLTATELMRNVALKTDATIGEIEESIEQFSEYEKAVFPYKKLLDLWLSKHFENDKAIMLLRQYPEKVIAKYKGQKSDLKKQYEPVLEQADQIAHEKGFFHWELEFPEVFIDLKKTKWLENPGFDVVIGNPPYDELSEEERGNKIEERKFLEQTDLFKPALGYRINVYRLFIVKALSVTKKSGHHSFIIPLSILADKFTLSLREHLLKNYCLRIIEQFPQKDDPNDRVFYDAKLSTCIYAVQKDESSDQEIFIRTHRGKHIQDTSLQYLAKHEELLNFDPINYSIPAVGENEWKILRKFTSSTFSKFSDYVDALPGEIMINKSIKPYLTDESGEEIIRGSYIACFRMITPKQGETLYLNKEKYLGDHLESEKAKHHLNERIIYQRYAAIDNYRRLIATKLPKNNFCSHTVGYLNNFRTIDPNFVLALLNSELLDWRFDLTSTNNNINGYEIDALPVPKIDFSKFDPEKNKGYSNQLDIHYQNYLKDSPSDEIIALLSQLINDEEYQLPLIHDFLAYLAEKMLEYNKEKQRLNSALDPFKFLNKGTAFRPFKTVFAESIKYGRLLNNNIDLGKVHHDIEGLKLEPVGDSWQFSVLLKHRDPATDWSDWQKDEDDNIVRTTQPVYQIDLTYEQGRYWQQSFEVLDQFENNSNFPGGKTRTTHEKLMESDVPIFDEKANIESLIELREELAEVEAKIEKTDWLIDQVVYRLYGLSEEEIGVVEGGV